MKIFSSAVLVPSVLVLALASYGAVSFGGETSPQDGKSEHAQEGKRGQDGADGKDGADGHDGAHEHGHEGGELHESMELLQQKMRALRKLMKPETKAEALVACQEMEAAVLVTMQHVPESPKKLEGSALLKYEVDFKQRMASVYGTLLDLQLAVDAGDKDKMKTLYRALGAQKKDGHTIYIDEKGK